ncbi:ABC transporter substrate-binding protein [Rhizobium sp. L1K21]|uniref:ABC transporter substrate-binding protein n=1 Tax=Rhizobium sp. L1K21 TaxID=2954933 RepID=UPI002092200F|nr:ABC transporter substrate-binding protein [Rhizobium sp. L1K21]MCO6187561.1 ABC transporter substrate-binding protein [Rhizobium sp. L1K21]
MRLLPFLTALFVASAALADDQTVTDDAGRSVTVPEHPQRIVVMHEPLLGLPLIDLGVNLTGSYGRNDDGSFSTKLDFIDVVFGKGVEKPKGIGPFGQIDLERLRALDPDLIIGSELDIDSVDQLSTVAPTYLQNVSTGKTRGIDIERDLAKLVGREDAFDDRMKTYRARLESVRNSLSESLEGKTYLAIFLTDQINAVGEMSGAVQALEDLGYKRLALDEQGNGSGMGSTLIVPLSTEALGRLEPDLLVVMNSYMSDNREEAGSRQALDKILPGWENFLKPAREGQVLFLDSAKVTSPTVASALHTLDAFEKWSKTSSQ